MNRKPAPSQASAQVVRLPVRPAPGPMGALLTLARYRAAWLRANPAQANFGVPATGSLPLAKTGTPTTADSGGALCETLMSTRRTAGHSACQSARRRSP